MTMTLFIALFTILAGAVSSLITEAVKKWYTNAEKPYSPNMIALVVSTISGGLGTSVYYILKGIPWTVNNIICIILMIVAIWVASMVGYDKVKQLLDQIGELNAANKKINEEEKKEA